MNARGKQCSVLRTSMPLWCNVMNGRPLKSLPKTSGKNSVLTVFSCDTPPRRDAGSRLVSCQRYYADSFEHSVRVSRALSRRELSTESQPIAHPALIMIHTNRHASRPPISKSIGGDSFRIREDFSRASHAVLAKYGFLRSRDEIFNELSLLLTVVS